MLYEVITIAETPSGIVNSVGLQNPGIEARITSYNVCYTKLLRGEFQDLNVGGKKLYEAVADKVKLWGEPYIGSLGYSSVGAVVGATYPSEAHKLRQRIDSTFFLVPGYGAQGAGADDIAVNFDENGLGAVVNASRGLLLAYKKEKYAHRITSYNVCYTKLLRGNGHGVLWIKRHNGRNGSFRDHGTG